MNSDPVPPQLDQSTPHPLQNWQSARFFLVDGVENNSLAWSKNPSRMEAAELRPRLESSSDCRMRSSWPLQGKHLIVHSCLCITFFEAEFNHPMGLPESPQTELGNALCVGLSVACHNQAGALWSGESGCFGFRRFKIPALSLTN